MRANVRQAFPAFERAFEGWERGFYRDTLGLVTFGMGNLAESKSTPGKCPQEVLSLFWRRIDNDLPASEAYIQDNWSLIKSLFEADYARRRASAYRPYRTVYLEDPYIEELVEVKLDEIDRHLTKVYPDFDSWPSDVQLGILNMAWNVGVYDFPNGWPNFSRAIRARDWLSAAQSCKIKGEAAADRNEADVKLFMNAARISWIPEPLFESSSMRKHMEEAIWYTEDVQFYPIHQEVVTSALSGIDVSDFTSASPSSFNIQGLYVQGMLKITGHYKTKLDGLFGPVSKRALGAYGSSVGASTILSQLRKLSEQTTKIPVIS